MANVGLYRLRPRLFLSDRAGTVGDDLSDLVAGGEVAVDVSAESPMAFTARLRDPDAIPAWSWVRPFFGMAWWDPAVGDDSLFVPVGHFLLAPVAARHTAAMGEGTVTGRDGCWLLKQSALAANVTYAAGANVVDAVKGLLTGAGFARVHIPGRSNTIDRKRTYEAGTPTLDAINDLLHRIAYYPLWFDREGVAMSRRVQPRSKAEPRRTIASADGDVVGLVEVETDAERLCNRVTVIGQDPKRDVPIVVTKENRRADSPASIANLGYVKSRVIEGSNVDTASEATDLANKALEEGASVERRVSLATTPDPEFAFHETLRLAVERDDGTEVAGGTWWWDQLRLGFGPAQMPQTWRLNKLVPWSEDG